MRKKYMAIFISVLILITSLVMTTACKKADPFDDTLEDTIRVFAPFADWLNITATYGEVFDKFIEDQEWSQRREDNNALVVINGQLSGEGGGVSFTLEVTADGTISPFDARVPGFTIENRSDALAVLMSMFMAYDEGYEHYFDMLDEADITFTDDMFYGEWAYFWGDPIEFIGMPTFVEFTEDNEIIIDEIEVVGTWSVNLNELTIISTESVTYVFIVEFWDETLRLEDKDGFVISLIFYGETQHHRY